jgi:hypothetical protein
MHWRRVVDTTFQLQGICTCESLFLRFPPAETDMQEFFHVSPPSVHARGSSEGNQGSPAASKCSLIQNTCRNYFEPDCQNHCAAVLVKALDTLFKVGGDLRATKLHTAAPWRETTSRRMSMSETLASGSPYSIAKLVLLTTGETRTLYLSSPDPTLAAPPGEMGYAKVRGRGWPAPLTWLSGAVAAEGLRTLPEFFGAFVVVTQREIGDFFQVLRI